MIEPTVKQYVEFLYERHSNTQEIQERDPTKIELPGDHIRRLHSGFIGFRFFDRLEAMVEGEVLKGDRKKLSGIFYIDGQVISKEEYLARHPSLKGLIAYNFPNANTFVITRTGIDKPLKEEDRVVPSHQFTVSSV